MKIPITFLKRLRLVGIPTLVVFNSLVVDHAKAMTVQLTNPGFEVEAVDTLGALPFTSTPATTSGRIEPNPFDPAGPDFVIVTENNITGWQTNASNRGIEIWESGFDGGATAVGTASTGGTQFAELNATEPTALFQDLTIDASATNTQLYFTFLHRARAATVGATAINAVRVRIIDDPTGTPVDLFNRVFATQLIDGSPLTNNGWALYTSKSFAPIFAPALGTSRAVRYQFEAVSLSGGTADIFTTTGATPTVTLGATVTTTNSLSFGNFIDTANLSNDPTAVGVPFDFSPNLAVGVLGLMYLGKRLINKKKA